MVLLRKIKNIGGYPKKYPVTSVIIFLITLVFLLTCLDGGSTNTQTLLRYGALYPPLVLEGEYFRFFTAGLLQGGGLFHYLSNIIFLLILSPSIERILGKLKFSLLYLVADAGGGILIMYMNPDGITTGASGFVFALIGAYLSLIWLNHPALNPNTKSIIVFFAAITIITTYLGENISIAGHIGGLVTGFFFTSAVTGNIRSFSTVLKTYVFPVCFAVVIAAIFLNEEGSMKLKETFLGENQKQQDIQETIPEPPHIQITPAGITESKDWSKEKHTESFHIMDSIIKIFNEGNRGNISKEQLLQEIKAEQKKISAIQTQVSDYPFPEAMKQQQGVLIDFLFALNEAATHTELAIENGYREKDISEFSAALDRAHLRANSFSQ